MKAMLLQEQHPMHQLRQLLEVQEVHEVAAVATTEEVEPEPQADADHDVVDDKNEQNQSLTRKSSASVE
jgi:hypothetical protein